MSVIKVVEIGEGKRRGEIGVSYTSGYVRHFRIYTNTPLDGPDEVLAGAIASGIFPARGSVYVQPATGFVDSSSLCIRQSVSEQQEDEPQKWLGEATYSSEYQPPIENFNPNNDAPLFRWGSEKIAQAMQNDLNGIPVVNSAGDPFQAQTNEKVVKTLTMTRNEPFYNLALSEYLEDSVNYYPIWGYGRGQAWLIEYSAIGPQYRNGIMYWPHTYVFKLDRTFIGGASATGGITTSLTAQPQQSAETTLVAGVGQPPGQAALGVAAPNGGNVQVAYGNSPVTSFELLQLLDQGKREIDPNNAGKLRAIMAGVAQLSDPVMLNGAGVARPLGPAVYLFFTKKWALDWTALNLPAVVTGN